MVPPPPPPDEVEEDDEEEDTEEPKPLRPPTPTDDDFFLVFDFFFLAAMLSSVLEANADDGTIADMDRLQVLALSGGGSGGSTNASAQPATEAATNIIRSHAEAAHSERVAAALAQTTAPVLEAPPCLVIIFMVKIRRVILL